MTPDKARFSDLSQLLAQSDFCATVVDDFLPPDQFAQTREYLLQHWAWRYKNWSNRYLHNYEIDTETLDLVAKELEGSLSDAAGRPISRVAQWAILANQDSGLRPHADNGTFVVNFWLTPDEYNLDSDSGGMVLFDVRRPENIMSPEFQISPQSDEYVAVRTRGEKLEIPYRCNRAVIFDARLFHSSLSISFAADGAQAKRLNVSMIFDDPKLFDLRQERGKAAYPEHG